jgi:aspartyl-tRNA(Asn)/glutamyl-tRNA(Gln) amidotransferase subunit A
MTDFTQATAAELSSLYQAGAASPVTVAEQVLAKIERVNPKLNAFCFTDADTTLSQAKASELRWSQAQPLSNFDGIPIAIKDSILIQGWPTLHASRAVDPDQSWLEDAPAVARLRQAGAVFAGKTTMSEFGVTANHSNSILYGNVQNPWNPAVTTGGSSGGSAVAVAANLVPLALGTDAGASIAVPCAFCGIFGMKPSAGIVSQYPSDVLQMTATGPMARTVKDIILAMRIISGPDIRDSTSLLHNHQDYTCTVPNPIQNLRIARVQTLNNNNIDSEISATIDVLATWLNSQGASVESIDLDVNTANDIFSKIIEPKIFQQWLNIPDHRRALAGREIQRNAILAHVKENLYTQLIQRNQFVANMRSRTQAYDIILGPATIASAVNVTSHTQKISPLSVFCSMTKQPSVTVPVGLNHSGMPDAVMIVGAMLDDAKLLQVAQAIEQQFAMPACPVIL